MFAAFHRKWREGALEAADYRDLHEQFAQDCEAGVFTWLPFSTNVAERVRDFYRELGSKVFLRAGDAVHLATAAANGCYEIYSNDTRLLGAAPAAGLRGVN